MANQIASENMNEPGEPPTKAQSASVVEITASSDRGDMFSSNMIKLEEPEPLVDEQSEVTGVTIVDTSQSNVKSTQSAEVFRNLMFF